MKKVLAFGEVLLRLTPPNYQLLNQANSFDCQLGGSELNVLSTLSELGQHTFLISAIPDNDIGRMAERFLFSHRIHQDYILKKEGRLGTYYYQKGFSIRPGRIIYDRNHSVFSQTSLEDYPIVHLFEDVDWFHVSGITVALSPQLYQASLQMMKEAKRHGVRISLDLNYRQHLWHSFEEAREKLSELATLADVCFGIEPLQLPSADGDLKDKYGLKPPYKDGQLVEEVVAKLAERYELESIAFTQREMEPSNAYHLTSYLYAQKKLYMTGRERVQVLDRVGTGDAFAAGIIQGFLQELSPEDILNLGMACFEYKHTIEGDCNIIDFSSIETILKKDSFEIKR